MNVKNLLLILSFSLCVSCSDAAFNAEDRRVNFEKYLGSFVGKKPQEVIDEFGRPQKYLNPSDSVDPTTNKIIPGGTYMIYSEQYTYAGTKYICKTRFKIDQRSDKVLDYDYDGDGCY